MKAIVLNGTISIFPKLIKNFQYKMLIEVLHAYFELCSRARVVYLICTVIFNSLGKDIPLKQCST